MSPQSANRWRECTQGTVRPLLKEQGLQIPLWLGSGTLPENQVNVWKLRREEWEAKRIDS